MESLNCEPRLLPATYTSRKHCPILAHPISRTLCTQRSQSVFPVKQPKAALPLFLEWTTPWVLSMRLTLALICIANCFPCWSHRMTGDHFERKITTHSLQGVAMPSWDVPMLQTCISHSDIYPDYRGETFLTNLKLRMSSILLGLSLLKRN